MRINASWSLNYTNSTGNDEEALIITLNGKPIPFEIRNHKIILGGPLEDCEIAKEGALGYYGIVISGTGFDNTTAVSSPIPLGQFVRNPF
jgi:hypothetical protein